MWQHRRERLATPEPFLLPASLGSPSRPPSSPLSLPPSIPTCFQAASLSVLLYPPLYPFSRDLLCSLPPVNFLYPRSGGISQGDTLTGACCVLPYSYRIISQFIFQNSKSLPFLPAKLWHFSDTPKSKGSATLSGPCTSDKAWTGVCSMVIG